MFPGCVDAQACFSAQQEVVMVTGWDTLYQHSALSARVRKGAETTENGKYVDILRFMQRVITWIMRAYV